MTKVVNEFYAEVVALNYGFKSIGLRYFIQYLLQTARPEWRVCSSDFRAGDMWHSLADIGKAVERLGSAPTHRIVEGLEVAMEWYVHGILKK